nr:retrovirus-related Pol polyprotein from transposon TNT 1-94 [Tanacetum cinerariifolium]
SKDEALEVIKTFLKRIIILLQSPVIIIRTDNGTKFKNQVLKEYFDSVGISHQVSLVRTSQQNRVVERRNRTLVEAARTVLIFSRASLFLWAEAIATACFTQNCSIIHRQFNKTPYELINDRKPDISFFHVFGALCYPKNDREDIRKLGAKGDIGFFIGYSADSCAYRFKIRLQSMTSGQISSGLDLTYVSSTITTQQRTEGELDLLFEAMYDDFIGGQPSTASRTVLAAQAHQVRQTPMTSTSIADTVPTPTNSSSQATNFLNTSQDVDELTSQQQHAQQQGNQALIQPETVADNVTNAMFDANTFVNPFATPSTSAAESSSLQYVDSLNMHTFYQPYPHEFQWTKDHPLEQVIGEPSRPVLTRNQLRSDGDMCMHALTNALYGLKQAPHAWYDELSTFLLQNHFYKGTIDLTLFIRRFDDDILVVQVYVDDIIFGSTHPSFSTLIEEPKSLKGKAQIEQDEAFTRQLEAELNADINWNAVMEQVKRSERLNDVVMKYQALKRKPLTEAQEVNEEVTLPEKEVKEEGHKREEATPLASKFPIVDYKIHLERNKPYFKIIRADGNHMLFLSFSTLLKNFAREDLESLWKLVKEKFEKIEPKNYTNDYLLKTPKTMFEQLDVESSV